MQLLSRAILSILLFCPSLSGQDTSAYYKTITHSVKAPIPEADFRKIEQNAYINFKDKKSYEDLSNLFLATTEKVWSIFYAEIYCNMAPNSEKSKLFSQRIAQLLQNSMTKTADGLSISLTQTTEMSSDAISRGMQPFENNYEISFMVSVATSGLDFSNFSIDKLFKFRKSQMELWIDKQLYQNDFIKYLISIKNAGHFEAYNYWLFSKAFPEEFNQWCSSHSAQYENFTKWVTQNRYAPTSNDIHRIHTAKQQ